jgi:tetratricopeptide (TPR) repeat protein
LAEPLAEKSRIIVKTAEDYFDDGGYRDTVEGDAETAIECYTEAIRLNPEFAEAWFNRAVNYEQTGRLAQALMDYKRYAELRPDEPTGHDCLARVYLYAEKPDLRDVSLALNHAKCACQLAGESEYRPLTTLAEVYAALGHYREAITCQKKAIRLASRNRETNDLFVPKMNETLAQYQSKHRAKKSRWKFW